MADRWKRGDRTPGAQSWTFRGHQVAVDYPPSPAAGLSVNRGRNQRRRGPRRLFFLNAIKSEKEMTIVGRSMLVHVWYRLDGDTLTMISGGRKPISQPPWNPKKSDTSSWHGLDTFAESRATQSNLSFMSPLENLESERICPFMSISAGLPIAASTMALLVGHCPQNAGRWNRGRAP